MPRVSHIAVEPFTIIQLMIAIPLPGKKAAIKVHAEIKWFTKKSMFSI